MIHTRFLGCVVFCWSLSCDAWWSCSRGSDCQYSGCDYANPCAAAGAYCGANPYTYACAGAACCYYYCPQTTAYIVATICSDPPTHDCPAGSYGQYYDAPRYGNSTCVKCGPGSFSISSGASGCSECSAGTYGTGTGASGCSECSAGTYGTGTGLSSSSQACVACAAGTYGTGSGSSSSANCLSPSSTPAPTSTTISALTSAAPAPTSTIIPALTSTSTTVPAQNSATTLAPTSITPLEAIVGGVVGGVMVLGLAFCLVVLGKRSSVQNLGQKTPASPNIVDVVIPDFQDHLSVTSPARIESSVILGNPMTNEEREVLIKVAKTSPPLKEFCKFGERPYRLKVGQPVQAAAGIVDRMSVPILFYAQVAQSVQGITNEVTDLGDTETMENLEYILNKKTEEKAYPNGIRDKGRSEMKLIDFVTHRHAQRAGLSKEQVAALRLYTTSTYKHMNDPLRDEIRFRRGQPVQLPVTTFYCVEAIKKLRQNNIDLTGDVSGQPLWRGMRDLTLGSEFIEKGGTELAFMSTTKKLEVAVRYSLSAHSLLLRIVPPNFLGTGVDVQWVSAFPDEAEILYPPLTFLKPTGRREEVVVDRPDGQRCVFEVVEVVPTIG